MTETLGEDQRAVEAARAGGGLRSVAIGLGVYGLSTYGYLGLAGQGLGHVAFAPLSVLWVLLNGIGIGLFLPFEQELGRRTAERRAVGQGNAPVVRQSLIAVGGLLAAVALVTAAGAGVLSSRLFGGNGELVPLFVLALAGMAASYVVRGLLAGNGRFGPYGAQLAVDGVLRVAGAWVLFALGSTDVVAYGAILVVAPVLAVLLTTSRPSTLVQAGPPQAARVAAMALGTLIVASLLSQALANAGTIVVQLLAAPTETGVTSDFLGALVIARVPLFLFAAVQAVLLPGLAGAIGAGDVATFRHRVELVGAATVTLGVLGTIAVRLLGAPLVPIVFGPDFSIDRDVITLIAASGGAFMIALAAAQALLALGAERVVLIGWAIGLGTLVVACFWQGPLAARAAWAMLDGAVAAMVVMVAALVLAQRRWVRSATGGGDG